MKVVIELDVPHGFDILGKRSPDGSHRECIWGRERIYNIRAKVLKKHPSFDIFSSFCQEANEPGLTNRVLKYNDVSKDYDFMYVLSIHNDAENKKTCGSDGWGKAKGSSVWTSRGEDESDPIATSLFNYLSAMYPNDKLRSAYWLSEKEKVKDPDWEADFTVLAGNDKVKPNYFANLLEWKFQTNKEDVASLKNKIHNEYFEDMIANWLYNQFNNMR